MEVVLGAQRMACAASENAPAHAAAMYATTMSGHGSCKEMMVPIQSRFLMLSYCYVVIGPYCHLVTNPSCHHLSAAASRALGKQGIVIHDCMAVNDILCM